MIPMPIHAPISLEDPSTWFYRPPPPPAVDQAPAPAPPPPGVDQVPAPPPPPSPHAQPHHDATDDIQMDEARVSPPPFFPPTAAAYASTFPDSSTGPSYTAGPSYLAGPFYPPPVLEPTIQDVYRLVYGMRQDHGEALRQQSEALHQQGEALRDLQERMGAVEDELRDWRWYAQSDYDQTDYDQSDD